MINDAEVSKVSFAERTAAKSVVGIGLIGRTKTVFFTVNGKEVAKLSVSELPADLFPTVSMGDLQDRVECNFG